MSGFNPVESKAEIKTPKGYKALTEFKEKVVDDHGRVVKASYKGREYEVLSVAEKKYSAAEMFGRGLLGTAMAITIVLLPLFFIKAVRDLFSDKSTLLYGKLITAAPPSPIIDTPPPPAPAPPAPAVPAPRVPILPPPGKASGIRNLGNTCYFNSSVQMLFRIPSFRECVNGANSPVAQKLRLLVGAWDRYHWTEDNKDELKTNAARVASALKSLYLEMNEQGRWNHRLGTQQDAQELIMVLADIVGYAPFKTEGVLNYEDDPIPSITTENKNMLSININSPLDQKFIELQRLINDCFAKKKVTGVSNTKGIKVNVEKRMRMHTYPEDLILYLVRFHFDPPTVSYVKTETELVVPPDNKVKIGDYYYIIEGYVRQDGTLNAGHYWYEGRAEGKDSAGNPVSEWIEHNDVNVRTMTGPEDLPHASVLHLKRAERVISVE